MLNIADGLLDAATYGVKVGAGGAGAILNAGVLAGNNGIGSQVGRSSQQVAEAAVVKTP